MALAPFTITPELTAVAIMYRNRDLIADQVMPRVPVGAQAFEYTKYSNAANFTIPSTKVGRKSKPNQVEWTSSREAAATQDHALDVPVPGADEANAPNGLNLRAAGAQLATNLIELDREVRVAALVFGAANYAAGNQVTLSGTSQWSDFANSDPLGDLRGAMSGMLMRPNILVLGQTVADVLTVHPQFVKAIQGNGTDVGIVPLASIASLLGLQAIYVGQGFVNTAKPGQAPTFQRVWGNHAALIYRDNLANADVGTTFGYTAQWGQRIGGEIVDPDMGMRGGVRVRVGESVKELITANDLGYLFIDAVA